MLPRICHTFCLCLLSENKSSLLLIQYIREHRPQFYLTYFSLCVSLTVSPDYSRDFVYLAHLCTSRELAHIFLEQQTK